MLKLYGSLSLFVIGSIIAIVGYFYAWVSGSPDYPPETADYYQTISLTLVVLAVVIMITGIALTVRTVKSMNKKRLDQQTVNQRRDG